MRPPSEPGERYRAYLQSERQAVGIYLAMANAERDPRRAQVFRELAAVEERHARYWASKLGLGEDVLLPSRPLMRTRLLGWLARWFGTRWLLPMVLRMEAREATMYATEHEAKEILADEQDHSRTLEALREGQPAASFPGEVGWHRAAAAGTLRAAVLGINDGLVSNFSLVWGVAGGTSRADVTRPDVIVLVGVAGLLAGAFSMAAGEYVSMRAQRDLFEHRIAQERRELAERPEEEREELSLIYQLKGLPRDEADALAARLMQDPQVALDTMAREELGLDPSQLGSPWAAAISSFFAFVLGAIVPVVPYLFGSNTAAFALSGVASGLALAAVGATLALLSGRHPAWGGLRMTVIGLAAAVVTFGIGSLVGIALG
ncbi:MAG: VIT1/CCC1 transporter family protein [Chloroflexi bacterium]|nr:VIT1/CCC1 transporter family protein [Chloroflexota bacterium]